MKLKVKPLLLVKIILIQLMLINIGLITIVVKAMVFKNDYSIVAEADANPVKPLFKENAAYGGSPSKIFEEFQSVDIRSQMLHLISGSQNNPIAKKNEQIGIDNISWAFIPNGKFIATAYDLSYESCGKYPSHPEYGITFSGTRAVEGRTIAVDPEVITIGSRVYVQFPKEYENLDGWYRAEDTGRKIKGHTIDVFFGEAAATEAKRFGRREVSVKIVPPPG
jgi:3D (Asp-Asp-Asp) domain-containing protein